jgi:heptosyltransferase-2
MASALRAEGFDAALTFPSSLSSAFLFFAAQIPVRIGWSAEGRDVFLTHPIPHGQDRKIHLVWDYLSLSHQAFGRDFSSRLFKLEACVDGGAKKRAGLLLGKQKSPGLIALGPGATYGPAKRWPLEYWKELIARLLSMRRETLVILGTAREKNLFEALGKGWNQKDSKRLLNLAGQTDVQVLAAVLAQSRLLVTNDSGPMHLAAAVQTPVVAIFGSTSPLWTGPFGKGHSVLKKDLDCSPCFQKTCPIGYPCLKEITVKEVFREIQFRLSGKNRVAGAVLPKGVEF